MKMTRGLAALVVVLMAAPAAQAQSIRMGTFRGFLTGHLGMAAGDEVSDAAMMPGVSVSVQEQDGWGAELDFGHAGDARSGAQDVDINTYMVNGIWVKPAGLIRPFGAIGGGIMQVKGCNASCTGSTTTNDFGMNVGAGVFALVNDVFGLRGDVRYLFTSADHPDLNRPDGFGFWRISIGATFTWAIVP